jgi:hypothetical protein
VVVVVVVVIVVVVVVVLYPFLFILHAIRIWFLGMRLTKRSVKYLEMSVHTINACVVHSYNF